MPIGREQARVLAKQLTDATNKPTANPVADLQRFIDNVMVKMPKGVLWMGAMPETDPTSDAMPRHRVDIDAFELSAVVVTQGLWRHLIGENPAEQAGSKKPIHNISWWDALLFCNRLSEKLGLEPVYTIVDGKAQWNKDANGLRLPTEAEWEYASRTRDDLRYSGGDQIENLGWTKESGLTEMPDVGMKEPNLWGFHDLSGLVFEWCWDDFAPYNQDQSTAVVDQDHKVCRGGSWQHDAEWAKCTARFSYPSDFQGMVGLRLARNSNG